MNNGISDALPIDGVDNSKTTALVVFETRNNKWAVDTRFVTGVRLKQSVTPLPGSERHALGCLDVVGTITPVFCLSELLGLQKDRSDLNSCDLILLGENRTEFALHFTGSCSFIRVLNDEITSGSPDTFPEPGWVTGTLADDTIILNGRALLDDGSFVLGHS